MRTDHEPVRLPAAYARRIRILKRSAIGVAGVGLSVGLASLSVQAQPAADGLVPAEQTAAANFDPEWDAPRLSWGDPDLQGTFTSRDMRGISMERPQQYGTRQHLNPEEFLQRLESSGGGSAGWAANQPSENRLALSPLDAAETGTRTFGYTSYIIDPEDGRMPALTEAGRQRQALRRRGQQNGPFYAMEDFSYYDRCITRGVIGSITPSLYGDAMRIVQSPTEIAISYEMLHDTRIIPLDGRAIGDPNVRQYMGLSSGRWEGDTLVVETTNFTDRIALARIVHSEDLKLTERITRIDPDMIDYVVEVDDPQTFERPWTFRLTLTTQPDYEILEYSCHEGNFFIANALSAEREFQRRAEEAIANGEPIPERRFGVGTALEIYDAPSPDEALDINRGQ